MDVAKLVLEYVQALVWPVFVLLLMIFFRGEFRGLLHRLRSAKGAGLEAEFGDEFRDVEAETREAIVEETAQAAASLEHHGTPSALIPEPASELQVGQDPAAGQHVEVLQRLLNEGVVEERALTETAWAAMTTIRERLAAGADHNDLATPRTIYNRLAPLVRDHPEAAILSAWRDVEMAADRVFDRLQRAGEAEPLTREDRRRLSLRQKIEELRRAGLGSRAARSMEELFRLRSEVAHGGTPTVVDAADYLAACDNAVWALRLFSALHMDDERGAVPLP
ncbi:hypothetical protein [Kitasatospora sp. NPDC088346]|uniref:hypothetical protein n=1 Tax=Kitasatospora sp. NPDC088346 TaxID=3364073 RepID=UPI0037F93C0F